MQETWQIGGRILAPSYMSIMHLSSGTVNTRTQLRLQVFYLSFSTRIDTDIIEALRCKLSCFGILVEGPAEVFCDNISVVKNSNITTSALNKRHNDIYYHRVREDQAVDILRVG